MPPPTYHPRNRAVDDLTRGPLLGFSARPPVLSAALLMLVGLLLSGCDGATTPETPTASTEEETQLLQTNSGDGNSPFIFLSSPAAGTIATPPLTFEVDPDAGEIIERTDYYFTREGTNPRNRREHIFLGTGSGTEPFIYEGTLAPLVVPRLNVQQATAVAFDDDGEAGFAFISLTPTSDFEVVITQSVNEAVPENGADVFTFPSNQFPQTPAAVDFDQAGEAIAFTVEVPETGPYDLTFLTISYSDDSPLRQATERPPLRIEVNGQVVDAALRFPVPIRALFRTRSQSVVRAELNAGTNLIRAVATADGGAPLNLLYVSTPLQDSGPELEQPFTVEAEDADAIRNVVFSDVGSGFSGTGYLLFAGRNEPGRSRSTKRYAILSIDVPTDGRYEVEIRYALPNAEDAPYSLTVQGASSASVSFPQTAGSSEYQTVSTEINLVQGVNNVPFSGLVGFSGLQFDRVTVRAAE